MLNIQNQNILVAIGKKIVFFLLVVALASCGASTPVPVSSVLSVQLDDGSAWLVSYPDDVELELRQSMGLHWNQIIRAGEEETATLRIEEDDQLWLDPGSRFQLVLPFQSDERPALRLLQGSLRYRAVGNKHVLSVHIETPFELSMLVADLLVAPVTPETELEIVIEDDITTLIVLSGETMAEGNDVSATLFADWRAIVRPGEPMEVIPPTVPDTPTPTVTPTPTRTSTPSVTPTTTLPTLTLTSTLTATLVPALTFTPLPTFPTSAAPTSPPPTSAPSTQPPSTQPPPTSAPSTQPPSTQPPSTQPPSTQPPSTSAPSTQPPPTSVPPTSVPPTQPPPTQPPPTQPPPTQPPPTLEPPTPEPPTPEPLPTTGRPTAGP